MPLLTELSEADKQRILEERAALLAAVPPITKSEAERSVMCFELGTAGYAVESIRVLEVSTLVNCISIPCTPPHIAGLVNQRGRLLTVIDLRAIMGLPITDTPDPQLMILAIDAQNVVGVRVDSLSGVRTISEGDLTMASELLQEVSSEVVLGIFQADKQSAALTILLDLTRLLTEPSWIVDDLVR